MNELKPISPETPKDTLLLVWSRDGFSIAEYDSKHARWYAHAEGKMVYENSESLANPEPSHWMPLPPEPQS